jgi:hypothetical protein
MPPKMIELMRQAAVPSNVMRSAARGALALPPAEIIEILVYLTENPVFAAEARMTLAGWDPESARTVAADPGTPPAVLDYLAMPQNLRPALLPALIGNPSVAEAHLIEIAHVTGREAVEMMLASTRVRRSPNLLQALESNDHLSEAEVTQVRTALAELGEAADAHAGGDGSHAPYEVAHAAEIAAEEGQPFRLLGDILDLGFGEDEAATSLPSTEPPPLVDVSEVVKAHAEAKDPAVRERISTLQKISRLSVGERVQLAMKGSRDERFILVRDGAKVVCNAVMESPKVTENEVELFASMKNVQKTVLRTISMKRRFMKIYGVVRALVNNPRTPIDVGLPLLNRVLVNDLRTLSMNKNVSDTIRKMALKLYKQRTSPAGRGE